MICAQKNMDIYIICDNILIYMDTYIYIYILDIHPEKITRKIWTSPSPSPGQPGGIPTGRWDLGPNELREDELAGEAWNKWWSHWGLIYWALRLSYICLYMIIYIYVINVIYVIYIWLYIWLYMITYGTKLGSELFFSNNYVDRWNNRPAIPAWHGRASCLANLRWTISKKHLIYSDPQEDRHTYIYIIYMYQ